MTYHNCSSKFCCIFGSITCCTNLIQLSIRGSGASVVFIVELNYCSNVEFAARIRLITIGKIFDTFYWQYDGGCRNKSDDWFVEGIIDFFFYKSNYFCKSIMDFSLNIVLILSPFGCLSYARVCCRLSAMLYASPLLSLRDEDSVNLFFWSKSKFVSKKTNLI